MSRVPPCCSDEGTTPHSLAVAMLKDQVAAADAHIARLQADLASAGSSIRQLSETSANLERCVW